MPIKHFYTSGFYHCSMSLDQVPLPLKNMTSGPTAGYILAQ